MSLTPGGAEDRIVEALKSLRRYLNYSEAVAEIIGIVAENVSGDRKPKKRELKRESAQGLLRYLVCNYLDEESEIRLALCSLGLLAEYPEWKLTERRNSYILTTGYTGKRSLPDVALARDLSADELRRRRNSLEKYENDLYAKIAVGVVEDVGSVEALEQLIVEANSAPIAPVVTTLADEGDTDTYAGDPEAEASPDTFALLEEKLRLDLEIPIPLEAGKRIVWTEIDRIRERTLEEIIGSDDSEGLTNGDSLLALGVCQEMGYGLSKNTDLAREAYAKAIKDDPRAYLMIGMMEIDKSKGMLHMHHALKYLRLAARNGIAEGSYLIALLYCYGYGVERNMESFLSWLKLAASQGSEMAKQKLEELERMRL